LSAARSAEDEVAISVIVPVRNRQYLLERLLQALDAQRRRDFEVIVVDDGSTDGADRIAEAATVAGRPVRLLHSGGAGAVHARRIGVQAARGAILAFTDSDCAPRPDWLLAGAAAIEDGSDLVNGRTVPARALTPLERSLGSGEEGLYPTANMFFRNEAFHAAGGFDIAAEDRLGFRHDNLTKGTGFGEDTLVAWRMIRMGYRPRYEPAAVVEHHVFSPNVKESLVRAWSTAAFPALVAEVPELRGTIMRRKVLFGVRSRVPFYATAGALMLGRRRIGAVAAAWWMLVRVKDMRQMPAPWHRKLAYLPAEMFLDVVMGTAMIVGSVKSRRVVL